MYYIITFVTLFFDVSWGIPSNRLLCLQTHRRSAHNHFFKVPFYFEIEILAKCAILGWLVKYLPFKGVISKFWNFLYYWSDLTEIFTQYVKLNKNTFCSWTFFHLGLSFLYIYKYIDIHIYIKKNRTPSVFMLE